MKKILTILLLFISIISFSQEYYRDTLIERAVFNKVNEYRISVGVHPLTFNVDNYRAIQWGEILVNNDLNTGGSIYHCGCAAGSENIAKTDVGDENEIMMSIDEIADKLLQLWINSESHRKGMENTNMTRGFNAVYVYQSNVSGGKYAVISVYQFLRDKEYYIELDWDENEKVPNRFL